MMPLLPVTRGHRVVPDWHEQKGPGDELGPDDDPRATVPPAHEPAAVGEDPILAAVEEDVGLRDRHVLDRRDRRDNH